jgi:hypothetical protein
MIRAVPDNTRQEDNDLIATDLLPGGIKVQRVKMQEGEDGIARDINPSNPLPTSAPTLTPMLDDSADPVLYVGEAQPGVATSAPLWRIKRVDVSAGAITAWADSDANFDNVWDDRVSLSYG